MTPAAIVGLVVQTLGLGAEALERVFAAHPELRDPPPAPADTAIDARIDARLDERARREVRAANPAPVAVISVVRPPAPDASAEVQDAVYADGEPEGG